MDPCVLLSCSFSLSVTDPQRRLPFQWNVHFQPLSRLQKMSVSFEVMIPVLMTRKPLTPLVQLGESCRCERLMISTAEETSICGSNLTHPPCRQTSQNQTCLSHGMRNEGVATSI